MEQLKENESVRVVADAFKKAADTIKTLDPNNDTGTAVLLTKETARKIWVAACQYTNGTDFNGNKVNASDFETFYKQLIEGK